MGPWNGRAKAGAQRSPPEEPTSPAVVINNTNGDNDENDAFDSGFQLGASRRARNGMTSASISVIDVESSQVAFAYSVGKGRDTNQTQSAAEACAKHLKDFIEKANKVGQ